jgi:hypothetical protein
VYNRIFYRTPNYTTLVSSLCASRHQEAPQFRNRVNLNLNLSQEDEYICCLYHVSFFLGLLFDPEDGGHMFLPELIFVGLRAAMPQKTEIFVVISVKISNQT